MARRPALSGVDPLRRRRVRRAATALLPGKVGDVESAEELAQLALARLLWLQHEAHQAHRSRQPEATAMLARAALDCLLVGLYCQYVPGAAEHLGGNLRRTMGHVLRPIVDGSVPDELFDDALATLSAKPRDLQLQALAKAIIEADGPTAVHDLYERYFRAVSSAHVHTTAFSLARQVHPRSNSVTVRPWPAWSTRSAAHACDSYVGMLSHAVAAPDHPARGLFETYANDHARKARPPILFIAMSIARSRSGSIGKGIVLGARPLLQLRRYAASNEAAQQDREGREQRVRAILSRLTSSMSEQHQQWLIDAAMVALEQRHPTPT
jgi:hypothetical protein